MPDRDHAKSTVFLHQDIRIELQQNHGKEKGGKADEHTHDRCTRGLMPATCKVEIRCCVLILGNGDIFVTADDVGVFF